MKLSRNSIGWLSGLVVLAVALGTGAFAPSAAYAAPPVIDPSSCGLANGASPVPNDFCSFETTGEDVVIGPNSCNVEGACLNLGNGVRINAAGLPFLPGSCNAADACPYAGAQGGTAEIGGDSCNGSQACFHVADGGSFYAGQGSCNGTAACEWSGYSEGSSRIGSGSCNGVQACQQAGEDGGDFTASHGSCNGDLACRLAVEDTGSANIGAGSCNGLTACDSVGVGGSFQAGAGSCNGNLACANSGQVGSADIGSASCNGEEACNRVGKEGSFTAGHSSCNGYLVCYGANGVFGPPSVGSFSCNYSGGFGDQCANFSLAAAPPVGDCMYNNSSSPAVIIYRTIGCALVGTPDLSPFEAIWQAILAAFAFN